MGRSVVLCVLAPAAAAFLVGSPSPRAAVRPAGAGYSDEDAVELDNHRRLVADVATFERSRAAPLVRVAPSTVRGAGRGVFAARDAAAGATLTEWTGLVAAPPSSRCEEIELMCRYYGARWREYNGRYEIGLAAPTFAGGRARAELGDFVIYGAPSAGAADGVAQLINDHSAIFAPARRGALLADGLDGADGVGGRASVSVLARATRAYLERAAALNNVAMVRSSSPGGAPPRVFAVATRPIAAGEELFFTYGAGWWLDKLRRACLAQIAVCEPSARRARALGDVVRAAEFVSLLHVDDERDCAGATGAVPRSYVHALAPCALDALFEDDAEWARGLLREEFLPVTECPFEEFLSVTDARSDGEHGT